MLTKIDHVGIAVQSIDDRLPIYRDGLGLEHVHTETVESQGVRVACLAIGESALELLEPLGDEGPVASFLESHGEGIHHLAVGCEDIDRARKAAEEAGLELLSDEPVDGAENKLISFVHPADTGGVLLEFCQREA
jgi:methylmalonyl-CoA epimerase